MHFAHPATPHLALETDIWRPDLATGIREIDLQHAELLGNVSALREAARTGNPEVAEGVLAYLERYAAEHFATEERVMWMAAYPELDAHWSLHLSFATELARRKGEYTASRSRASLLLDLARWMDGWLEDHLLGADAEMARFVRGQAVGPVATPTQRHGAP
jgi:hemerythrin